MKNLEVLLQMIREFYYEKNGKQDTISFLKYIVQELEKTRPRDWEKLNEK